MKLVMDSCSVAVVSIAMTSLFSAVVITGLESFLTNKENKKELPEIVKIQLAPPKQVSLEERRYSQFLPEVYAIKPEEEVYIRDWRNYSVRTNSKFG